MMQQELSFISESPINQVKLTGQNLLVYKLLQENETVTMFTGFANGIYHFHSRVAEVAKQVTVHRRMITKDGTTCKEYSLKEFLKKD